MAMIQIRNVSEATHRQLKARAALDGRTLSDFLKQELDRLAERPSRAELLQRLAAIPPVDLPEDTVDALREERAERDPHATRPHAGT